MLTSTSRDQKVRKKKPKLTITNLATAINPLNYDPIQNHPSKKSVTGKNILQVVLSIINRLKCENGQLFFIL